MASTWTPTTSGMDWQAASFLNELKAGIAERWNAVWNDGSVPVVAAGDDIQAASFWASMQNTFLDPTGALPMVTRFVDTVNGPTTFDNVTPTGGNNYDPTYIPVGQVYLTLATWQAQSGLTSGFRRATVYPANPANYADPAFSYGVCQPGDIIGPWLWDDLHSALGPLNITLLTGPATRPSGIVVWDAGGVAVPAKYGSGENKATMALAQAAAIANYANSTLTNPPPQATTTAYQAGGGGYYAQIFRQLAYIKVIPFPNAAAFDADLYVPPMMAPYGSGTVFDANGDPVNNGTCKFLETVANATGPTLSTNVVGNLGLPIPNWNPTLPGNQGYQWDAGLDGLSPFAVLRWRWQYHL